jgi:hypothetical protein
VLPVTEMRRLMERERARSQRTGQAFSLLAFTLPGGGEGRKILPRLTAVLHKRLRSSDSVGWLEGNRIAVLLPGIPLPGARRLGQETLDRLSAQDGTVSCKVSQPWAGLGRDAGGIQLPDWEPVVGGLERPVVFDEKGVQVLDWVPTIDGSDSPVLAERRQADNPPLLSGRS